MEKNDLYLKTAFCCMACDGDIAPEEIAVIESRPIFSGIENLHQKLMDYVELLKSEGSAFLKKHLDELKTASLTEEEELKLAGIVVDTIEADKKIEYNEIAFFKKIRKRLNVSDEKLLTVIQENPDVIDQITPEDYLLPDLSDENDFSLWTDTFAQINVNDVK